jgi:thymidylate synthase (FAD)
MNILEQNISLIHCTHFVDGRDTDLMPVAAARVSFGNDANVGKDREGDKKLTNYLAKHKHLSPFEHQTVGFKIECPIFVAREWMRHRSQAFNEISLRYTDKTIGDFWLPEKGWRMAGGTNRQGSGAVVGDAQTNEGLDAIAIAAYEAAEKAYFALLERGIAKELARIVISVGHMTEFYATASLRNWAAFCMQRLSPLAQEEIRVLAEKVDFTLNALYPDSWGALKTHFIGDTHETA